jgi:hypothetical protein
MQYSYRNRNISRPLHRQMPQALGSIDRATSTEPASASGRRGRHRQSLPWQLRPGWSGHRSRAIHSRGEVDGGGERGSRPVRREPSRHVRYADPCSNQHDWPSAAAHGRRRAADRYATAPRRIRNSRPGTPAKRQRDEVCSRGVPITLNAWGAGTADEGRHTRPKSMTRSIDTRLLHLRASNWLHRRIYEFRRRWTTSVQPLSQQMTRRHTKAAASMATHNASPQAFAAGGM